MKKFLLVVGIAFVAIVVTLVVAAAIFIPQSLKLDKEAVSYVQDAVPKIVANWNAQELVDRATPELMNAAKSRDKVDQLFVMFSKLGALKHLDTPEGAVVSTAFFGQGAKTIGNYRVTADFDNGRAEIQIQLLRVNSGWKVNGFHINSNAFMPTPQSPTPVPTASPSRG